MTRKILSACFLSAVLLTGNLIAQQPANPTQNATSPVPASQKVKPTATGRTVDIQVASQTAKVDPVVLTNQMMLVFMERMKSGNLKEARDVADEMVFANEKYVDTDQKVHRSFHSAMEKELFALYEERAGRKRQIEWVDQPVSDGFYFLAILDFQENKHEEALANMQKAIFWNPVRSAFYAERGFMFLRKNSGSDIVGARIAYEKALELADNSEDFAAALRGLAFVLVERRELEKAVACLVVSKEFDAENKDADEEIQFIRRADPALVNDMNLSRAREVMKEAKILSNYSADHVQVLIRIADSFKSPEDSKKAVMLLKKANEMSPKNPEVVKRLNALKK